MLRIILRLSYVVLLTGYVVTSFASGAAGAQSSGIEVLRVDGTIVPVTADYVERGITEAEEKDSVVCIIHLNTPGGLLDATARIVQRILSAKVPIVVYVSPHGSWAASAGTFITIAADIAVMAPGTSIGAAHPVSVGQEMPEDQAKKATEYSAAWIRSVAEKRGRDPEEAELAVTESKSFTASEALEANLIDFLADDLKDLIQQIDGRKVTLADGRQVTIDATGYFLTMNDMSGVERFLQVISHPNIAYILLSLATIGLMVEISNPGMVFPGVAGGLSLLLAFYSLGVLNAHWAGILLIFLAFGFFVAEIFTPTFGILTAGGAISLVIGSLVLFSGSPVEINKGLIVAVTIVIVALVAFLVGAVIRGQRRKVATGVEALVGTVAVAQTPLAPKGTVLVEGERWTAVANSGRVEPGEEVIVTKVDGLKLIVTSKKKGKGRK